MDTQIWSSGSSSALPGPHKCGALTAAWQAGTEVNGQPVAPAQVGVVGQCGTQAGLPATAGISAALLEVGHGAQVRGAGRKQLPREHAAGLQGKGGWRWTNGLGSGV